MRSEKQMFVVFYKVIVRTDTEPFIYLFFLHSKAPKILHMHARTLHTDRHTWEKGNKPSIVHYLEAQICTRLTQSSPPLSPQMSLTWQFNSGRSEIPILWMSHYSPPQ